MTELQFWQGFWFFIIGVALFIFTWLDGFDQGIGMQLPFQKNDDHKRTLLNVIWPFWGGNELYGLIGGGAIFAAFPVVFAGLLSGLHPWLTLLIVFVMLRPVALEAWLHDKKGRQVWEVIFSCSNFVIPFVVGVAVGSTVAGLPYQDDGFWDPEHSFFEVLSPLSVLTGAAMVAVSLLHSSAYMIRKTQGELSASAYKNLPIQALIAIILLSSIGILILTQSNGIVEKPLLPFGIPLAFLMIAIGMIGIFHPISKTKDFFPFLFSSLVIAGMWVLIGAAQFPVMIFSSINPEFSMTIFKSGVSNPLNSLRLIGILATIALAIVMVYSIFVYRVFKGKMNSQSHAHY